MSFPNVCRVPQQESACSWADLVEERASDVDDTASGTDWLMLNSQQYLMHCLQHRKKRHQAQLPARRENVSSVGAGVSFIFNERRDELKRSRRIFEVTKRLFKTFCTHVFLQKQ